MSTDQPDLDLSKCLVDVNMIGFGITLYSCFNREFVGPLGLAWTVDYKVEGGTKMADLLWVYTLPPYRRRGIARLLLETISSRRDAVMTGTGTDEGGRALIESVGFRYLESASRWLLRADGQQPQPPA